MKTKTAKTTCAICHKPFSYNPAEGEQTLCKSCLSKRWDDEHTFVCKTCGRKFRMEPGEVRFFESHEMAFPKNCPDCRAAKKLAAQTKEKRACKSCGKEFVITVGESQWFREKGMELPVRCSECRRTKR